MVLICDLIKLSKLIAATHIGIHVLFNPGELGDSQILFYANDDSVNSLLNYYGKTTLGTRFRVY